MAIDIISVSALKDDLPANQWYGIKVDESVSDPSNAVTRIGNTALHTSLPVHSKMVAALINDDESVDRKSTRLNSSH